MSLVKVFEDSIYPTSIVHLDPLTKELSPEDSPLFVWIPGNPGLLEYYVDFLALVHKKNPTWEVLGISHAGMSYDGNEKKKKTSSNDKFKVFDLEEQVQHKVDIINKFSSKNRPLIIMGHSVGAYLTQRVIMTNKLNGKLIKVGYLTPTVVDIHLSDKGIKMTKVFNWTSNLPHHVGWISQFIFHKLLPLFFVKFFISKMIKCSEDSNAVLASGTLLRNANLIEQALGLATYEMEAIHDDWGFHKKLIDYCNETGVKTWFLFAEDDHWVAHSTRKEVIDFYQYHNKPENIRIDIDTIPHAFVIKKSKYIVDQYF
ncbi:hypothetical protein Kpol_480p17 [Vanderwaltozyma polyspora DSM 70294]|uniref:Lipid droplet-associated hydrolase n=1 Tax=Vanderwaltozyma polyspora (strain ATCC 22028 / DSM 70294 / BCRC 21397 / CBS 2163 / NBRC 10782 / NRRL Y-8283 / UCD 57-17) TaxID=436907 RepID=A7TP79_VANPO|nr:uncharacterized protein Kpol_480p17 [Vanderwaltozyma polyspora DSM 70294]EDO15930.1 hypothetical protein Kpol_480p17 [Vanderwaltozyma polyspora DSM 70294]